MYSLNDVYPEHLQGMPEFLSLGKATDRQVEKIGKRIDEMRDNLLITTARESGIADREKILGIVPLGTDTLEERRYRVLLRWYDTYPYTEADLRARLDRLCGKGTYNLLVDKKNNAVSCTMPLASLKMVRETWNLLDEILSLNVALKVGLCWKSKQKIHNGGALTAKRRYCVPVTVAVKQRKARQTTFNGTGVSMTKRQRAKED